MSCATERGDFPEWTGQIGTGVFEMQAKRSRAEWVPDDPESIRLYFVNEDGRKVAIRMDRKDGEELGAALEVLSGDC